MATNELSRIDTPDRRRLKEKRSGWRTWSRPVQGRWKANDRALSGGEFNHSRRKVDKTVPIGVGQKINRGHAQAICEIFDGRDIGVEHLVIEQKAYGEVRR